MKVVLGRGRGPAGWERKKKQEGVKMIKVNYIHV
jgi:hypothetical protein